MTDEPNGTVFLEWPRSRGEVARLVLEEFEGKDLLHLRFFYPDAQGNQKPTRRGVTIPFEQIGPLRKALRKVIEKLGSGSKSSRTKEEALPKPAKKAKSTKKANSWG